MEEAGEHEEDGEETENKTAQQRQHIGGRVYVDMPPVYTDNLDGILLGRSTCNTEKVHRIQPY